MAIFCSEHQKWRGSCNVISWEEAVLAGVGVNQDVVNFDELEVE